MSQGSTPPATSDDSAANVTSESEVSSRTSPAGDDSATQSSGGSTSPSSGHSTPTAVSQSPPAGGSGKASTSPPSSPTPASPPKQSSSSNEPVRRGSGPLAARGLGIAKPKSPTVDPSRLGVASTDQSSSGGRTKGNKKSRSAPTPKLAGQRRDAPAAPKPVRQASESEAGDGQDSAKATDQAGADSSGAAAADGQSQNAAPSDGDRPSLKPRRGKVAVPNLRQELDDDLQAELDAMLGDEGDQLVASAVETIPRKGEPIADGSRVHGVVLKIHDGNVYVALGGPDEGVVAFEQFETEPTAGQQIEVVVRGATADGLYQCGLPGGSIEVSDWDDLQEGAIVDASVTGTNSGGLEAKVGGVEGFIPISQISEYRVEDTTDFVGQKFLCVVTEANPRRRKLVLSRRAILEREREEKKKEQLAKIEVGDEIEGTVRSIKDFGAFVDLGALDGLIHISKLSWERVKHPSDVLEEGQKVKVRLDKVDKETGKISLSYRDLLENPWDTAEAEFAPGSIHSGSVTKVAPFGCFVRLTAGVEGMVHISELASHRVSKVDAFVSEGDTVSVKVLTFDRDAQKISLSIKQANKPGAPEVRQEADVPPPEVSVKPQHDGPLRGGNNRDTGGDKFGLRW